ncbi:helix-turn-helix domain-containing protein [Lysinibacillus telephonicus]|uniref:XRE family transcriptional regulator n=1 Tax=Lysinibacillus telephonicus TaxID=1714840 RepID=A0A3S0HHN0_9BACI|nr:helix-turn-helix transcriptional regulator [Lysinibacillus telephonicus]RTQ91912.1 XRE family transcriptional regulator [Lysinibacillus telephonicus]
MKQRQLTPLGKKIVKRLVDLNQTQVWLCEKVGVSKVYLNFILHGERSGKKYMDKIIEVLGLDEEEQQSA